ncbi:hypothetical protein JCM18899A_34110 [Nocardioides sp. AN3]
MVTEHCDRLPGVPEVGRAVLLPGRAYTPAMPLLAAVVDVLLQDGWAVREVWWTAPDGLTQRRTAGWVADEARTAAAGWAERPLLIGKSLGTFAAPYAARERLDSVWLTPLLGDRRVRKGIRRNRARQLLVGGTADEAWVPAAAARTRADVLELPDADHSLVVKGDKERTLAYRAQIRDALTTWLGDASGH